MSCSVSPLEVYVSKGNVITKKPHLDRFLLSLRCLDILLALSYIKKIVLKDIFAWILPIFLCFVDDELQKLGTRRSQQYRTTSDKIEAKE